MEGRDRCARPGRRRRGTSGVRHRAPPARRRRRETALDRGDSLERRFETPGALMTAERADAWQRDAGFLVAADGCADLVLVADPRQLIERRLADLAGFELVLEPARVHHPSVIREVRVAADRQAEHVLARLPI